MATKNIKALGNAQSIGWTDALISRLAANSFGLGGRLSITAPANASALSTTGYSLTGSNASSMIDLAGTWNTTGTPTLIKANITDTASNAASLLMDLQVGGSSKVNIDKTGKLKLNTGVNVVSLESQFAGYGLGYNSNGEIVAVLNNTAKSVIGLNVQTTGHFGLSATSGYLMTSDVILLRDASNTLALRNSTNAQALNIYNTYTSGSVYERGFMRWVSNVLEIGTEHVGGSNREIGIRSATGQVKVFTQSYNVNTFTSIGASNNGSIAHQSNSLGQHYVLIGDTTGGGGPAELRGGSGFTFNWRSTARSDTGSNDTGLARTIANVVGITNGSTGGGALGLVEMTSPAAPAVNGVYIFAEDNGSGKTRLMARFATGATQQLAIEP